MCVFADWLLVEELSNGLQRKAGVCQVTRSKRPRAPLWDAGTTRNEASRRSES